MSIKVGIRKPDSDFYKTFVEVPGDSVPSGLVRLATKKGWRVDTFTGEKEKDVTGRSKSLRNRQKKAQIYGSYRQVGPTARQELASKSGNQEPKTKKESSLQDKITSLPLDGELKEKLRKVVAE